MRKRVTESSDSFSSPTPQEGAFFPDGSYRDDAGWSSQGPAHALVSSLVRQRRAGRLTPQAAAAHVSSTEHAQAFPSIEQWATCPDWFQAQAATSAEAAVKYAGKGVEASK